jgi:ferrous-iron efflux pump FieF
MTDEKAAPHRANLVSVVNVLGSVVLAASLLAVFVLWASELALAQAADSISDVLTGLLLAGAARAASQPADDEHPLGHARAEPIAALVVAVLAGVLATEVARSAVVALASGEAASFEWPVATVFAAKVVFKLGVARVAGRLLATNASPVLDALRVDARNDAVVGSVALVGFGLARAGLPAVDPVLAIGVAIYVAISSIRLAIASVYMLLGTSAPPERRAALSALVSTGPGVAGVANLVAISHGALLHVEVDLLVDASRSLREGHEVAHAVEALLRAEPDVAHAVVHVTPWTVGSA